MLEKANIDMIKLLKQFLKSITKGLGPYLFDAWRYNDEGYLGKKPADREINPDFVLNKSDYEGINAYCR